MRKKILIVLGVLALLVVVFLVVVALQPSTYRVSRTALIAAPPASVFPHVNEVRKWEGWNPWGKLDPAMKLTYDGPASGQGASYAWVGNNQVGEGKMTVTESRPNELVRFKLEFFKPMAGTSDAEFTFKPEGNNQTAVTWSMSGENNFIAKAMCLFMNMDTMIGGQFEKGLASMKSAVEATPKP
jgi:uncharacterized protein YndB with AHSA1/START domain